MLAPFSRRAALSKRLKGMSHVAFLAMEVSMFDALLDCLRAVDTTAKAVEAVLSEVWVRFPPLLGRVRR